MATVIKYFWISLLVSMLFEIAPASRFEQSFNKLQDLTCLIPVWVIIHAAKDAKKVEARK